MSDLRIVVPGPAEAARLAALDAAAFPDATATFTAEDYLGFATAGEGVRPTAIIADQDLARCVAVLRFAADEVEVLTLGVIPSSRRTGSGRALLRTAFAVARRSGAVSMFLEVAANNDAARALYGSEGFAEVGRRSGYYRRRDGSRVDALVLRLDLAGKAP
ncbi:MAG: GNAT family N-acetyltransferase [Pseudomonadota bacterium]